MAIPVITFSDDCDPSMLDSLLNTDAGPTTTLDGEAFGWAVRISSKDGFNIVALWGSTDDVAGTDVADEARTTVMAWSHRDRDFTNRMVIRTADITKVEVI